LEKKVISKDLWLTVSHDFFVWGLLRGKIATNIVLTYTQGSHQKYFKENTHQEI
jgi:hypothetical protein